MTAAAAAMATLNIRLIEITPYSLLKCLHFLEAPLDTSAILIGAIKFDGDGLFLLVVPYFATTW